MNSYVEKDFFVFFIGDVFNADWDGLLNGVAAVVSTIGGFGNNEQMEKINGEANLVAVNAASDAGNINYGLNNSQALTYMGR